MDFICVNTEQGWEISVEMVATTKIHHRFDYEPINVKFKSKLDVDLTVSQLKIDSDIWWKSKLNLVL